MATVPADKAQDYVIADIGLADYGRAEIRIAETEMAALRAQMNPHFIFNCLSSINRFILKNESERLKQLTESGSASITIE